MAANPTLPNVQGTSLVDRINVAIHLRRYLKLIGRRWWILVLSLLGFTGYKAKEAHDTPNSYRATSKLGFQLRVVAPHDNKPVVIDPTDSLYDTEIQRMGSRAVMARVDESLRGYSSKTSSKPKITKTEASKAQGAFLTMGVEGDDFEYVRAYVSSWARVFVSYKGEQANEALEKTSAQSKQDLERYLREWDKAREELRLFKEKHLITSGQDTGGAAQELLDRLTKELRDLETLRKRLENYTREELAEGKVDGGQSPPATPKVQPVTREDAPNTVDKLAAYRESNYSELKRRLRILEFRKEALTKDIKPKHPEWIKLMDEEKKLKEEMKIELESIEEKRLAQIAKLKQEEAGIKPEIERAKNEVSAKANINFQFSQLNEKEKTAKESVDRSRLALQSIEATPMNQEVFTIIDEGVGNPDPIGPNRVKIILNGLLIGLAVGVGLIYLLHRLDDRLDLAEDIEAELEEPVLGQVPQMEPGIKQDGCLLVTKLDQHNMFAESIRGVRSAVLFSAQGASRKVMLISSAVPGDGKTTFTVNFAATLAGAGHKVLLVDADLRRGNIHNYFGKDREPGLTEVLQGAVHWDDVVHETEIKTLQIVNSGKLPANPGELLMGPVAREFILEARREYDYVLFDCPPLTAIDDTFCLLPFSDGLLFVIKAGQTSMRFAKNALASVRQRGAEIIGLVLNGITADNPYYYYNYYYHAYYTSEQTKATADGTAVQPATKMASRRRQRVPSIDTAARERAGAPPQAADAAEEERRKAQDFKARRSIHKEQASKLSGRPSGDADKSDSSEVGSS
jgi:succinoglycan biosynthesis transport protein ExoP